MTEDEKDAIDGLSRWIARIQATEISFGEASKHRLSLTFEAAKHLRNISEAIAGSESAIQSMLLENSGPSREAVQEVALHLREIHHALDNVILPAKVEE